jgi:hypothetical protein
MVLVVAGKAEIAVSRRVCDWEHFCISDWPSYSMLLLNNIIREYDSTKIHKAFLYDGATRVLLFL